MARFRHRTLAIVDRCRSTTTPSGSLPLAQTARGGDGVLRGCVYVQPVTRSGSVPGSALIRANGISSTTGHGRPEGTAQSADEATGCRTSS